MLATKVPYEMPSSDQLRHPQRLPQGLHVRDHVVGAVERTARPERSRAAAHRCRGRRGQIGASHLGLQCRTVERAGAGASLIHDHDPVLVALGGERAMHKAAQDRQPRLTRPAGEDQQARRAARRGCWRPRSGDQAAGHATAVIERHGERRAGESAGAGARVGIAERGITRLAEPWPEPQPARAASRSPARARARICPFDVGVGRRFAIA